MTRSSPKISTADLGELAAAGIARGGGVLGADDVGEVRLERREQPLVVLVGHHADHPDQRRERERVLERGGRRPRRRAGCGRRRARSVGLRRTTSSRPGEVTSANAARTSSSSSGSRRRGTPRPRPARPRRSGPGGRRRAAGTPRRSGARSPWSESICPPTAGTRDDDAELDALADHGGADLGGARAAAPRRPRALLGEHGDRAGLDDPGLLDGDLARACRRGTARGRRRPAAPRPPSASATLVASHEPPMPTSTTADVDGGVREGGVRHRDHGLEERQRVGLVGVDQVGVRRDVVERAHELLVVERLAVDEIRSVIRSTCGLVNRPVRRSRARSRVSIIRDGRGLAVGAGQVDHRVRRLRVAEQLGERPDPVERRLEPGLGPAREQGVLDLGEGLGEAGCVGGRVSHRVPSLGTGPSRARPSTANGNTF